jgi:hypothetical protein
MFKFLSFFRKNKDEQLNDNEYDFNETQTTAIGVEGTVNIQKPLVLDEAIGAQQEYRTTPAIDTTLADKTRIADIKAEIKDMLGDSQPNDEDETTTADFPTSEINKEGHLQPPNLELVKGYKEEREQLPPGVTHYRNGDIELWFVNASHEHTGGINEDPTLRTVKMVIDGNDPKVVITEGHSTNLPDAARETILQDNRARVAAGGETHIPESGYAALLADQKDIPWVGGEISGPEFFEKMKDHGFSKDDIVAIAVANHIAYNNLEITDEEEIAAEYATIMQGTPDRQGIMKRLDPQQELDLSSFTFDKFREWYKEHALPGEESFLNVSPGNFVPEDKSENIFKRWMADSGEERDRHIARVIYDQLKKHRRGVITYGADHLNSLDPVIVQMFGKPGEYTQLVKDDHDLAG